MQFPNACSYIFVRVTKRYVWWRRSAHNALALLFSSPSSQSLSSSIQPIGSTPPHASSLHHSFALFSNMQRGCSGIFVVVAVHANSHMTFSLESIVINSIDCNLYEPIVIDILHNTILLALCLPSPCEGCIGKPLFTSWVQKQRTASWRHKIFGKRTQSNNGWLHVSQE